MPSEDPHITQGYSLRRRGGKDIVFVEDGPPQMVPKEMPNRPTNTLRDVSNAYLDITPGV